MSTKKSLTPEEIKASFDQFFESFSEEELQEQQARLLAFKFLSEVEKAMEKEGMNRKELAQEIGTSASYVTQLFRGDRLLNFNTLAKMVRALGLDFEIKDKSREKSVQEEIADLLNMNIDKRPGYWVYHTRADYSKSYEPTRKKEVCTIFNLSAA